MKEKIIADFTNIILIERDMTLNIACKMVAGLLGQTSNYVKSCWIKYYIGGAN